MAHRGFPGGSAVKNLPAMKKTQVRSLGWKNPLEEGMETHFSILAWRFPRTKEPGRLQSTGLQRAGHDWSNWASMNVWPIKFRQKKSARNFGESLFFSHREHLILMPCLLFLLPQTCLWFLELQQTFYNHEVKAKNIFKYQSTAEQLNQQWQLFTRPNTQKTKKSSLFFKPLIFVLVVKFPAAYS